MWFIFGKDVAQSFHLVSSWLTFGHAVKNEPTTEVPSFHAIVGWMKVCVGV